MKYRQLTISERYLIEALLYRRFRQKEIAETIGVHPSTVSREIRRNKEDGGKYFACWAERRTFCRRHLFFHPRCSFTPQIQRRVEALLRKKWSPEQIVGHSRRLKRPIVSHERIYQHVWSMYGEIKGRVVTFTRI